MSSLLPEVHEAVTRLADEHADRSLRSRWRRMTRRGHVMALLGSALTLGVVATGSAQVAGLDPFAFLTERDAPRYPVLELDVRAAPHVPKAVASTSIPSGEWHAVAYLSRDKQVCAVAGQSRKGLGAVCTRSSEFAAGLTGHGQGRLIVTSSPVSQDGGLRNRLVYGAVDARVRELTVSVGEQTLPVAISDEPAELPIDRRTEGLTAEGRAIVEQLPAKVRVRAFLVAVEIPAGDEPGASVSVVAPGEQPVAGRIGLHVDLPDVSPSTTEPRTHNPLARYRTPPEAATAVQIAAVPALGRPPAADALDGLPQLDERLKLAGAARDQARRLNVTGEPGPDPVWVLPAPGQICTLSRNESLTGCRPDELSSSPNGDLGTSMCGGGLSPDERLLWGFPPAGTKTARLSYADGRRLEQAVGDLVVVLRDRRAERLTSIAWSKPGGGWSEQRGFSAGELGDECAR